MNTEMHKDMAPMHTHTCTQARNKIQGEAGADQEAQTHFSLPPHPQTSP